MVWLCEKEPVRTFQKGPPSEKAKLRRWWTYLSQLGLTVHHIQGVKNECADYISRNNFDALIGARSEALAKEAFSRMDVHLDLNMTMIRPLKKVPTRTGPCCTPSTISCHSYGLASHHILHDLALSCTISHKK